jgi:hypothetical protein
LFPASFQLDIEQAKQIPKQLTAYGAGVICICESIFMTAQSKKMMYGFEGRDRLEV